MARDTKDTGVFETGGIADDAAMGRGFVGRIGVATVTRSAPERFDRMEAVDGVGLVMAGDAAIGRGSCASKELKARSDEKKRDSYPSIHALRLPVSSGQHPSNLIAGATMGMVVVGAVAGAGLAGLTFWGEVASSVVANGRLGQRV